MRKAGFALVIMSFVLLNVAPADAANKTTTLTKAFQKYLSDGETSYVKAMASAKATYEPQISSALGQLKAGQSQLLQANQVTILKTTSHSPSSPVAIDAINCPATRSDCKDPTYKSNEFKAGEVATVYSFIGGDSAFSTSSSAQMNIGILQTIDLEVKDGLISLNNAAAYNNAVTTIRNQYQNALTLSQQYATAQSDAAQARDYVQSMEPTIQSALLSAKRAAANTSNFDLAFVTSFKFEYNAKRLDELARAPWTYISSLKALQDAVSVTKQSALADSISARYSYTSASKLNSTYGNLFLSEQVYKVGFQLIASIYKSATGVTLNGK